MSKKYFYDYPENRAISAKLKHGDRETLARVTGFSMWYIQKWCAGIRKSELIKHAAELLIESYQLSEQRIKQTIEANS